MKGELQLCLFMASHTSMGEKFGVDFDEGVLPHDASRTLLQKEENSAFAVPRKTD